MNEIKLNVSQLSVSGKYGISKITLKRDECQESPGVFRREKMGPLTILTVEQEVILVKLTF